MWATFDNAVLEPTQTFQSYMKTNHKKKKNITMFCDRRMKTEELLADKKSIEKFDELKAKKKHAYSELDEEGDKMLKIDDTE